ncbi:Transcription initiation factor TFIID, subunit TAF12 (also component of histone acetyltransferase SAGA) [Rothia dentocariosa]|uniref:Transcription initiation factor TFIID, subunit TAF12 (Also component of histone acetyltransferase SAGA) n=1 Tax=Rothia dentocariosa TaxID=2047 RepID=A0A3S5C1I0_9MICC|nr:Transcription initiation factor TFIID, subunit TAF12 (also component of histone acetyltransferase SAGA) [Rothia dentocariosa]
MAFRYSRPAMTGAAIFTLAGVTVLPLAQANAAPASPQDEARSGSTQSQPNSAAQNGQDQGQQQGANANGQGQQQQAQPGATQGQQGANASGQNQDGATQGGATQDPSQAASGGEQQQGQPGASQDKQGTNASGQGQQAPQSRGASSASQNGQGQQQGQPSASQDQQQGANANGQGQQAQGASASQSSSNSKSASQNNQSRQSQPSAPAVVGITSVDGFIDPQKTDNSLTVETTGIDDIDRVEYDLRVQELDEFGNIVNDDVSTGGASSINSDGDFGISAIVDGTKINPNHHYRVYIDAFDRDTLTASYAYYPVVVWNRTYIPVVPLSVAR